MTGKAINGSPRGKSKWEIREAAQLIDSRGNFAWKLGSCRNYRRAINQRIMSQTRTRVVQTCQSFLDSFAGIFQSFERMAETIFHALLCTNNKKEGGSATLQFLFKETLLIGSATAVWFHLPDHTPSPKRIHCQQYRKNWFTNNFFTQERQRFAVYRLGQTIFHLVSRPPTNLPKRSELFTPPPLLASLP